jgi:hypothetical protein
MSNPFEDVGRDCLALCNDAEQRSLREAMATNEGVSAS